MKPYSNKHTLTNRAANLPKSGKGSNKTIRQFKRTFKKALRQEKKIELLYLIAE